MITRKPPSHQAKNGDKKQPAKRDEVKTIKSAAKPSFTAYSLELIKYHNAYRGP